MTGGLRIQLRGFLAVVDAGFLLYWAVTALHLLPPEWLYPNAHDPMVIAWNWSFLPLDLVASATGFAALWAERRAPERFGTLSAISLAFTSASGLNALAFWALRGEVDWAWWAPNAALLLAPWWFLAQLRDRGAPAPLGIAAD